MIVLISDVIPQRTLPSTNEDHKNCQRLLNSFSMSSQAVYHMKNFITVIDC